MASYYASAHPDGLEHVAEQTGFIDTAEDSATADGPLADYSTRGIDDARLSGGVAGVVGVVVMLLLSAGLFWAAARGDSADSADAAEPRRPDTHGQPDLMGAGHGHRLHFHGHGPVHRAPAHLKLLALLAFMILVVATPRDWYAAFAAEALLLLACRRPVPRARALHRARGW